MATVKDMLRCPKCGKHMMGKSRPQKFGKEYFAHCCKIYFGVNELVNTWNYDAADLTPTYPVTHGDYKNWIPKGNYPMMVNLDYAQQEAKIFSSLQKVSYSEFAGGEPYWITEQERVDAYEMVIRMLMGVPEFDDYIDLQNTQNDALQIGVQ